MKLLVTLERDETGMVVAECPSIPGCISQGERNPMPWKTYVKRLLPALKPERRMA